MTLTRPYYQIINTKIRKTLLRITLSSKIWFQPACEQRLGQNFRGFDIRGVLYVYINHEIQGMPVGEKLAFSTPQYS